jgi:hypothetical protein
VLTDNTVGDGPYNAWIDPILADEWQMIGWNNVSEMTKYGMPGVFTHGNFDTWSPGYLMFIAALHNGISRLYETFGNGGADTVERTLQPGEYARTWYKQNPPERCGRSGTTTITNRPGSSHRCAISPRTSSYSCATSTKSKRSILKARTEGPRVCFPRRSAPGRAPISLRTWGVEISRDGLFTVMVPGKPARPTTTNNSGRDGRDRRVGRGPSSRTRAAAPQLGGGDRAGGRDGQEAGQDSAATTPSPPAPTSSAWTSPRRIADSLLDYQCWSPNDPRTPTTPAGPSPSCTRAGGRTDGKCSTRRSKVSGDIRPRAPSWIPARSSCVILADIALATLRYKLKDASFEAAEAVRRRRQEFNRGSFIVGNAGNGHAEGRDGFGPQIVATSQRLR